MNTLKWYLGISLLFLISACTSYNIQKRHYTKGLYWNVSHVKPKHHNRCLQLNSKRTETAVDKANQELNPQASMVKNPEVLKPNTQQPKQVIKNELVFKDYKNLKMLFNTKPHFNAQSKAFKNSKTNVSLKLFLTQSKGWEIFKIILLCYFNLGVGIFTGGLFIFSTYETELLFPAFLGLGLFVFLIFNIIKRIKNLKTNKTATLENSKKSNFISGYRILETISFIAAFSFLMPIIINYINYINWYKTLPAYLIFKPLITPSKGIEPLLIVFLGLALLAAWLGTSKYKFSDPKHQKLQRIKTFIISGLLFLTGLLYLLIGLANVLNFVGLPFYAPVQHPEGSAYLIVCGLISIATALMPSKLLFGKNLITELKNKFK